MKGNTSQCGIRCCRKQCSQITCLDFYRTAVALLVTTVISIHGLNYTQNKIFAGSELWFADSPWQEPMFGFIPENYTRSTENGKRLWSWAGMNVALCSSKSWYPPLKYQVFLLPDSGKSSSPGAKIASVKKFRGNASHCLQLSYIQHNRGHVEKSSKLVPSFGCDQIAAQPPVSPVREKMGKCCPWTGECRRGTSGGCTEMWCNTTWAWSRAWWSWWKDS